MKSLYLHIGLGKTGSSALQSWLSLNAKALEKQGFDYADLVPVAKQGSVSSGNGYELYAACRAKNYEEVERLLTSVYFYSGENEAAIVSCEVMQGLQRPVIQKLRQICDSLNIEVTVIAYVRSIYEQSYSAYLQSIKRGGAIHRFGEKVQDLNETRVTDHILRYFIPFRDRLLVLNYDGVKDDIYHSFAAVIGINIKATKKLRKKVNRSLTTEEAEVLREVNKLHKGDFSSRISDYVIGLAPDLDTAVHYEASLVDALREASCSELSWLNDQFQIDPPLVSDYFQGDDLQEEAEISARSYSSVVKWALDYAPEKALFGRFIRFLSRFSQFMEELSPKDSQKLAVRAAKLKKGASRKTKETGSGAADKPDVDGISRFLLCYFQGPKPIPVDKQGNFQERLSKWFDPLHMSTVGRPINFFAEGATISSGQQDKDQIKSGMTGYTVLELDSMETALEIARCCPFLETGGTVEVSRLGWTRGKSA